jgi:hypothetical protein
MSAHETTVEACAIQPVLVAFALGAASAAPALLLINRHHRRRRRPKKEQEEEERNRVRLQVRGRCMDRSKKALSALQSMNAVTRYTSLGYIIGFVRHIASDVL